MIMEDDIKACIEVLERGGVILYPTDTIWGIGCDATCETIMWSMSLRWLSSCRILRSSH